MISAQIKKGNIYLIDTLQDYLLQMIVLPTNRTIKPIKYNYYNFIQIITEILNQFSKSKNISSFNLFLIDYFVRKYEKESELYRQFFGLTQSWKRFVDSHQDAKLFLSLLTEERNNKETVKRFVKIRKIVLKTIEAKVLEQISITHSDALTICHMIFDGENRNKIIKKINTLFINLKRKLVNTAKINGAVGCQFFMSASQQLQNENYPAQILARTTKTSDNAKERQKSKNKQNYDLSFSQQYASCYAKDRNNPQPILNKGIKQEENEYQFDESCGEEHKIKYCYPDRRQQEIYNDLHQNLQQQWVRQKGILNLNQAKRSLNKLSMKDRDIDAKLQGSGLIEWNNYQQYPEGWDQFIQNNQKQKQKLLNGGRY